MADNTKSSPALAFILGAVVVIVAGILFYMFSGEELPGTDEPEIQIDLPDGG